MRIDHVMLGLRVLILGPLLVPALPAIMAIHAIAGAPGVRHYPRWTWQLLRYGYTKAVTLP